MTTARDYLVTLFRNGQELTFVWNASRPIAIDHPARWLLCRTNEGIEAREVEGSRYARRTLKRVPIPPHAIHNRTPVALSAHDAIDDRDADHVITLTALAPIPALYERATGSKGEASRLLDDAAAAHEYYLFCGLGRHLLTFGRVGTRFKIHVEPGPGARSKVLVFAYERRFPGHVIQPYAHGLWLEIDGKRRDLPAGAPVTLNEKEWLEGTLFWENHWWRVSPVPLTSGELLGATAQPAVDEDSRLYSIARAVSAGALLLVGVILFTPVKHAKREIAETQVKLKAPNRIVKSVPPRTAVPAAPPEPAPVSVAPLPPATFQDTYGLPKDRPKQSASEKFPMVEGTEFEVEEPPDGTSSSAPDTASDTIEEPRVNHSRRPENVSTPGSPNGPSLSSLLIKGNGYLEKSDVQRTLERHLPFFKECYEKALAGNAKLKGVLEIQWTIQTDGTTRDVRGLPGDVNQPELVSCVVDEVSRITFPRPRGGEVQVTYPLVFSSSGF